MGAQMGARMDKPFAWWVLFLNLEQETLVDKFILDTIIGCEVSLLFGRKNTKQYSETILFTQRDA